MDVIPYTVHPREDTGVYNGKLGIWLFLASEVMLFGALFASYVMLRAGAAQWPSGLAIQNIYLGGTNTLVLMTSSFTMSKAWKSLKEDNFKAHKLYLALTMILGVMFLCIKFKEYTLKFHHEFFPETNTYLAIYFTLTSLHALHIIAGLVVLFYLFGPGSGMWKHEKERFTNRMEISCMYWHFVDIVWITVFITFYLL